MTLSLGERPRWRNDRDRAPATDHFPVPGRPPVNAMLTPPSRSSPTTRPWGTRATPTAAGVRSANGYRPPRASTPTPPNSREPDGSTPTTGSPHHLDDGGSRRPGRAAGRAPGANGGGARPYPGGGSVVAPLARAPTGTAGRRTPVGPRSAGRRRAGHRGARRGDTHGEPRPTFTSETAKWAFCAAMARSQVCASRKPPPYAISLTAAIVGLATWTVRPSCGTSPRAGPVTRPPPSP